VGRGAIEAVGDVEIVRSIIAFGREGEPVHCNGGTASLTCCDVFGNQDGDWVGCIAGQELVNDNFSADPLFCLEENAEAPLALHSDSPCLPEWSPCGELVGALDSGCVPGAPVEERSWGTIKGAFR
jgi:hypothetical protein